MKGFCLLEMNYLHLCVFGFIPVALCTCQLVIPGGFVLNFKDIAPYRRTDFMQDENSLYHLGKGKPLAMETLEVLSVCLRWYLKYLL